jgi:phospholipid/cholesterol/gamma-HCH transport system substrate-binding protein
MMREPWTETIAGAVVLALAGAFLIYSLSVNGSWRGRDRYEVVAKFGEVGSLSTGAPVRVAGVKVGTVSRITLDPKTFLAVTRLSLDRDVKLPADSTARITGGTLLGESHVEISPGGADEALKPGAEIENTQGAVDIFNLIGQMIRPPAKASPDAAQPEG